MDISTKEEDLLKGLSLVDYDYDYYEDLHVDIYDLDIRGEGFFRMFSFNKKNLSENNCVSFWLSTPKHPYPEKAIAGEKTVIINGKDIDQLIVVLSYVLAKHYQLAGGNKSNTLVGRH
jgi:hypothetical protein